MRISDWSSDVCASDLLGSFAADALTEPLLMMFKTPFADKRLTLEARIEGDVVLVSDKPLLMRALANLLSNSYQYSDRGGARIALARAGERATITVADTGRGMPPDVMARLKDDAAVRTHIGRASCRDRVFQYGSI